MSGPGFYGPTGFSFTVGTAAESEKDRSFLGVDP
jgi:hypothetical protein